MKIRPKIPIYQMGNKIIAPQWYIDRYGGRTALQGWNLDKRYNYANSNLNLNDHRNAGDLNTVFRKNSAYTSTPGAISSDIQSFYNSDANGMSAEDFVKFYNENAEKIRSHWNQDRTYNASTAGDHNRLFRRMFQSRSNQQESPGSDYNIGYQEGKTKGGYDIQDIEGSSTWLRRMDQYENEFDPNNPDSNRLHEITLKDRTKATVYKKANGDIALLPESPNNPPSETPQKPNPQPQQTGGSTEVGSGPIGDKKETPQQGNDILGRLRGMIPGLLSTGRLAGNLINNARVYDEALKGIRPTLLQPYYTHRQVVGDEATKQAYYRRAAAGQTKAVQPFTSDADRQMAYMQEARRVGDELRAQGDLADNQEIRRTSDESNQHQWANTQRATEVANTNSASLNDANEKKHTLLAQKHSAQWSSVDNYLKEIETRKRQQMEEDNAYNKQIDLLEYENFLNNDPELKKATEDLYALRKNGQWDVDSQAYKEAKAKYDKEKARVDLTRLRGYRDINRRYKSPFFIKSGSKITYKKDDKLLYKSTKDVVDHFRRMCRRYPEKERKIQPLAPHPDGTRRRKYQVGGQFLAPFTIYTPAVGIGESSRTINQDTGTSSKSSSSSKDTAQKDMLDLIKMFKDVKGIKVDVSSIYSTIAGIMQEAEVFGKELNSQQIATMYLRAMQQLNNVSRSKEIYDKAYEVASANGALNEIAVNSLGQYAVQDRETGEIKVVGKIDTEKHIPLTNSQLLHFREMDPQLAFEKGDRFMQDVIANGVGLSKIGKEIKDLAGTIGSTEGSLEGLSKVESGKVKAGIALMLNPSEQIAISGAPDGDYSMTIKSKEQKEQIQAAMNYIKAMLPRNYKAVMDAHGGEDAIIQLYLGKGYSSERDFNINPLTGKAASSKNETSSSGDKVKATFNDLLQRGQVGVHREFSMITRDDNTKLYSLDAKYISQLPKVDTDMSIDRMLSESEVGKVLDSRLGITFGDQIISPENLKDIMFSVGGGATAVTLPCKYENGHKIVNFAIKDEFDDAIKQASETTPIDWTDDNFKQNLANILKQKGLDSLLTGDMQLDPNMLGQFLVVEGYSTDRVKFNKNSKYIEKISNPDKELEERLSQALSTKGLDGKVQKYDVDINDWGLGFLFEGGWDDIYHASVFIPLNNDPISAQIGSSDLDRSEARQLASEYQNYQKLIKAKNTNSNQL